MQRTYSCNGRWRWNKAISVTATLEGFDIFSQQIGVRRQIGYCPQFDALFERMTVREHLELFATIKGVPRSDVGALVAEKIHQLNLADFENKLAGSLSGGKKRKLSTIHVGRHRWHLHNMEKHEDLCSRVGIMVDGCLRCYGSVQHFKSRFGDGLVFDAKLDPPTADELEYLLQHVIGDGNTVVTPTELEDKCRAFGSVELAQRVMVSYPTGCSLAAAIERAEAFCSWCVEETRFNALKDFLLQALGADGVVVLERQNDFCHFKVRGEVKLSKMLALVEDAKPTMRIREYSVS
ncbi:ATP-binding cassette sub- A member 12 [Phytophthora pseudosyringae]|uniref:ATP-binding cassette sub- A member 12 n=1 Tax=Phytophthora pseudosyringae TaxID=221518 RepID=A0A8T1VF37_9STRA|nr:ATP-binding cassette sub- A member 12 [Phytophthora pseudosyringae]